MNILPSDDLAALFDSEHFHLLNLPEFLRLYDSRPMPDNTGGMQLNHSYLCYCLLKLLSPSVIIESGVWKGASTWLLHSVIPRAQLFCLDPVLSNIEYKSSDADYRSADFLDCDWSTINTLETLCIFDDHQSSLHRCLHMKWWGFKYALFEDNYPSGQGDFYSIQQITSGTGHPKIQLTSGEYRRLPLHSRLTRGLEQFVLDKLLLRRFYSAQAIVRRANNVDRVGFASNVDLCFQLPCLVRLSDLNDSSTSAEKPSLYSRFSTIQRIVDRYLLANPAMLTASSLYYNNITFVALK